MDEVRHLLEQLLDRVSHLEGHRPDSEFVTVTQAAFLVSVSENTIRRRLRDKSLGRYGKGKRIRISRAELMALYASENEAPPSRAEEILSKHGR